VEDTGAPSTPTAYQSSEKKLILQNGAPWAEPASLSRRPEMPSEKGPYLAQFWLHLDAIYDELNTIINLPDNTKDYDQIFQEIEDSANRALDLVRHMLVAIPKVDDSVRLGKDDGLS
jgi:hypothetical protein